MPTRRSGLSVDCTRDRGDWSRVETPASLPDHAVSVRWNTFRDLGSWPVAGHANKFAQRNRIFRYGEPTKATATDISKVKSLSISYVFDLRSNPEIKNRLGSNAAGAGGQGAAG